MLRAGPLDRGLCLHEVRDRFFQFLSILVCPTSWCSMVNVLDDQGNPEEALAVHRRSLVINLKVFVSDHLEIQENVHEQGMHAEALEGYTDVLAIKEKVPGCEHLFVADTYNKCVRARR